MMNINKAEYVGGYTIRLLFNNGMEGTVDLKDTVFNDKRAIFSMLKDKSNFKDFKIKHSTVTWSNELDLAPEYLFYLVFKNNVEYQHKFKQWGYMT